MGTFSGLPGGQSFRRMDELLADAEGVWMELVS
jgi:hypothetical protein